MMCYYCERRVTGKTASRDHVVPKCLGGTDVIENIEISCGECNSNKGGLLLFEWEARLKTLRCVNMMPNPEMRARVPIILKNIRRHPLYEPSFKFFRND